MRPRWRRPRRPRPRLALLWLYDCNLREPAKLLLTDAAATAQRTAERPAGMAAYVQRQRLVESLAIKQTPSKKQPLQHLSHFPKLNFIGATKSARQ